MGRMGLAALSGLIVVILVSATNVVGQPVGHAMPASNLDSSIPRAPIINEIAPVGSMMQPAWIELHNPLDREIDVSGLVLGFSVNTEIPLPVGVPRIPESGFLVIVLDGEGPEVTLGAMRDLLGHGEDGATVVHVPQSSASAWLPNRGMLALYMPVHESHEHTVLVDFAAWGAPVRGGWTRRDLGPVWPVTGYVTLQETSGIYDPETTLWPGESIGLLPGVESGIPGDWAVYSRDEITPGAQNPLPRPRFFTPPSGAAVKHEDLKIAWKRRIPGERYQIEFSKSLDFSTGVQSFDLDAAIFRSEGRIEPGKYLYRVRRFAATPETPAEPSVWSEVMSIEGVVTTCGNAGATPLAMHMVLDSDDFRYQRKDTGLLCLGGCDSERWDQPQQHGHREPASSPSFVPQSCGAGDSVDPSASAHGVDNCARASIAMMVSRYDQCLSQDRIAYFGRDSSFSPDGDLAHRSPMRYSGTPCTGCDLPPGGEITEALMWALGIDTAIDLAALRMWLLTPSVLWVPSNHIWFSHTKEWISFDLVRRWLDNGRPIMSRATGYWGAHARVVAGYCIAFPGEDDDDNFVRIFDPNVGSDGWEKFETWKSSTEGLWVGPMDAPNARSDENSVWNDKDGDEVMDFDEIHRFTTNPSNPDSDGDGVGDLEDILGYVSTGHAADFDGDGLRKEIDPDNDNDGCPDGVEDPNHDGMEDADGIPGIDPGETSSFDDSDCTPPP